MIIIFRSLLFYISFEVNFRNSKDEEAQIALHLSVRFDEDIIVRNTRIDGAWGPEEREENLHPFTTPNPIVPGTWTNSLFSLYVYVEYIFIIILGETFKIYILVGDQRFHIAINDEPYCTYTFRMPLETIRTIQITRDIQSVVQIDHRSVYPTSIPAIQVDDNNIEFSNDIPKKFPPGKLFVFAHMSSPNVWICRSCAGNIGDSVWQSTRNVHNTIYRRSIEEASASFQCKIWSTLCRCAKRHEWWFEVSSTLRWNSKNCFQPLNANPK